MDLSLDLSDSSVFLKFRQHEEGCMVSKCEKAFGKRNKTIASIEILAPSPPTP